MREYGQYCALAKALDVVGDRWTLLIVRELSIRPSRYTDIRDGLPGIATNLLADRLRSLEDAGIVTSEAAGPPIATTLYRLTPRGEELIPAMNALGRWGAPLLGERSEGDIFRPHWVVQVARAAFNEMHDAGDLAPFRVLFEVDGEPIAIWVDGEEVRVALQHIDTPDARIVCDRDTAVGLLTATLDIDEVARRDDVQVTGDPSARTRLRRLLAGVRDPRARAESSPPAG